MQVQNNVMRNVKGTRKVFSLHEYSHAFFLHSREFQIIKLLQERGQCSGVDFEKI